MSTEIQKIDPALIEKIRASFGEDGSIQPFVKEIYLIEFHVAGTSFSNVRDIEPSINPGDALHFFREPGNAHDPLAIKICDNSGNKLGYIPRDKNEVLARLMDGGKLLFGIITEKKWHGDWLKITLKCFMRDY
jgi:hypothetical protein